MAEVAPQTGFVPKINASAFGAPGRALQQAGREISALGAHYQKMEEKRQRFQALTGLSDLGGELEQSLSEYADGSADGSGIIHGFKSDAEERSSAYLASLPESMRDEFGYRVASLQNRMLNSAAGKERAIRNNFFDNQLSASAEKFAHRLNANPTELGVAKEAIAEMVEASGLPEYDKAGKLHKLHRSLEMAHAQSVIRSGDIGVMEQMGGWLKAGSANAATVNFNLPKGVTSEARAGIQLLGGQWASKYGKPFSIKSSYRDPAHNRRVGGAKNSQHVHGKAFDISTEGWSREQKQDFIRMAGDVGFRGFGVGKNSIHVDMGKARSWGYAGGVSSGSGPAPRWAQSAISSAHKGGSRGGDKGIIANAAKQYGIDANVVLQIAKIESNFSSTAKNPRSSARGYGQFINSTAHKYGLRNDGSDSKQAQAAALAKFTRDNYNALKRAKGGAEPSGGELYLAHFAGLGGASKLARASNSASVEAVLGGGVIKANPFLRDMTVGQVKAWADKKMGGAKPTPVRLASVEGQSTGTTSDASPYQHLTVEDRQKLLRKLNTRYDGDRYKLKQQMEDAEASIRNTGVDAPVDLATAAKVLTPNQVNRHLQTKEEALAEFKALSPIETMATSAFEGHIENLRPNAGEEGYGVKSKIYTNAVKRIDEIRKLRSTDPALSVDEHPLVTQAKAKENITSADLATARLAAQEALGIHPALQSPVTKAEAKVIIAPLMRLSGKQFVDGMRKTLTELEQDWGRHAEGVFRNAVEFTLKSREKTELALGLLERIMKDSHLKNSKVEDAETIDLMLEIETFLDDGTEKKSAFPAPSKRHAEALLAAPEKAEEFDFKFGPGAAKRILGKQ
jgi:hypothetical protein